MLKNGLSGTNVHQRPGYAQIGYVESQAVKRAEYENKAGALLTPALNATGDLNLSFRAMAYKTCSDRPKGKATEPKDKKGDLTEIVVEVIGDCIGTGDRCVQHLFADDRRRDGLHGPALYERTRFGRVLALVHRRYLCDEVGVAR